MVLASRLIGPDKATTKRIVPRRRRLVALVSALALVVAGCASEDADAPSTPAAPPRAGAAGSAPPAQIVATTTIWADVTRNVSCGGLAEVESILPPLADPHDFEPSMSDRAQLDEAHLVVANGLGLEEALEDTLASVEADGTPVFTAGDHMTTLAFDAETSGGHDEEADHDAGDGKHEEEGEGGDDHGAEDDDHGHGSEDPHVWLDPLRVAAAVANLADALIQRAGLDADRVISCSDAYLGRPRGTPRGHQRHAGPGADCAPHARDQPRLPGLLRGPLRVRGDRHHHSGRLHAGRAEPGRSGGVGASHRGDRRPGHLRRGVRVMALGKPRHWPTASRTSPSRTSTPAPSDRKGRARKPTSP